MTYTFGTYDETSDGKTFRVIDTQSCDCDAQADLHARHIMDIEPELYELSDMDGDTIKGIFIRRGDVEWFA